MSRTHVVYTAGNSVPALVPFTPEEENTADAAAAAAIAAASDPSNFPLSDRQLRLGLVMNGISLSVMEAAIAGISDPLQKATAQIWWDRSIVIHWAHPMTQSLMALVNITEQQAAAMWLQAKDLEA